MKVTLKSLNNNKCLFFHNWYEIPYKGDPNPYRFCVKCGLLQKGDYPSIRNDILDFKNVGFIKDMESFMKGVNERTFEADI